MSDTKPLEINEKIITTLAIIGGLLLLLLGLTKCQSTAQYLPFGNSDAELSSLGYESTPSDELSEELNVLRKGNNEASESIDMLQNDLNVKNAELLDAEGKLVEANKEIDSLNSKVNRLNSSLSDKSNALPAVIPAPVVDNSLIGDLKSSLKKVDSEKGSLNNKVVALEGAIKGKDAEIEELKRKIQGLNTERDALFRTKEESEAKLKGELNALSSSIKTGESNDVIKQEVAKVEGEWKKKLDELKVKHELDKAKYNNALKSELSTLRVALRKEKTKKVFANSSDDLAPSAQSLIKNLSGYKGESQEDLDGLYKTINSTIGSSPKVVVNFASGSSAVNEEYQEKINNLLANAKADSYFIAVGYADTTGSANANKSLSSKRATRVAEVVKPKLNETQFVQAFYLGQTERFGGAENNRVVEIWEIQE